MGRCYELLDTHKNGSKLRILKPLYHGTVYIIPSVDCVKTTTWYLTTAYCVMLNAYEIAALYDSIQRCYAEVKQSKKNRFGWLSTKKTRTAITNRSTSTQQNWEFVRLWGCKGGSADPNVRC